MIFLRKYRHYTGDPLPSCLPTRWTWTFPALAIDVLRQHWMEQKSNVPSLSLFLFSPCLPPYVTPPPLSSRSPSLSVFPDIPATYSSRAPPLVCRPPSPDPLAPPPVNFANNDGRGRHAHTYYSLFSPTPSLCSMVSHKFGMRSDARTFNLSGMGCSAGVISLDLAKVCMLAPFFFVFCFRFYRSRL